jgi:hypothetical protein
MFFGAMCLSALLLFATLNEDGTSASVIVVYLMLGFVASTSGLLLTIMVESVLESLCGRPADMVEEGGTAARSPTT